MIKAPFNFVPLNKYVFIPSWHAQVSHDLPFKDGEDGIIRFTIKNLTPLHISQEKQEQHDKTTLSIPCHIDINGKKCYFIPATSLKGMIRNVAEILSFSKLNIFNDDYFGYREFGTRGEVCKRYHKEMEDPYCGFLKKEGPEYNIYSCGKPERILIVDINRKRAEFESEGKTLVKSGPMNKKNYEHLFGPKTERPLTVPDEVIKEFRTVYKPSKYNEEKLKALEKGEEVPVFFHTGNDGKVKRLGLSRNYRLPYKKRVAEGIVQSCKNIDGIESDGRDMTETLFGFIGQEQSLKGRVQFKNAFCNCDGINDGSINTVSGVLGQPQASYYPLYLKQAEGGKYTTYDSKDIEIAGHKRYRIHKDDYITSLPEGNGNEKVMSTLKLLPVNSTFEASIAVHNLKPAEIGLLLSALTFHNTQSAHHNIGMGKSYGYGKLEISNLKLGGLRFDTRHYLMEFEKLMSAFTNATDSGEWADTEQVKQLIAIASDHSKDLEFIALNDYKYYKDEKNYSTLQEENCKVDSIVQQEKQEKMKKYSGLISEAKSLIEQSEINKAKDALDHAQEIFDSLNETACSSSEISDLRHEIANIEKHQKEVKANKLIEEAKTFETEQNYQAALQKYQEAAKLCDKDLTTDIRRCEEAIKLGGTTFDEHLKDAPTSTAGAFTGHIDKWIKLNNKPFGKQELEKVKAKSNEHKDSLKKKRDRDKWKNDFDKWINTLNINELQQS